MISLKDREPDSNYTSLQAVLDDAYDQASEGKGKERHAQDLPFTEQPMAKIQSLVGNGFTLGQAIKKIQESQRLPPDRAYQELLGAINYIAGAAIAIKQELLDTAERESLARIQNVLREKRNELSETKPANTIHHQQNHFGTGYPITNERLLSDSDNPLAVNPNR